MPNDPTQALGILLAGLLKIEAEEACSVVEAEPAPESVERVQSSSTSGVHRIPKPSISPAA
ncbi:MAG: hypothetical protein H6718_26125 [Polyangiaceae bacterium]|nr:hypothetical protein [Polyangiaceae bacterium]